MDNVNISQSASAAFSSVNRIQPTTSSNQKEILGNTAGAQTSVHDATPASAIEQQLFALEQHVPLSILQNPQLLKAEWAWKLLLLQQLAVQPLKPEVSLDSQANAGSSSSDMSNSNPASNSALGPNQSAEQNSRLDTSQPTDVRSTTGVNQHTDVYSPSHSVSGHAGVDGRVSVNAGGNAGTQEEIQASRSVDTGTFTFQELAHNDLNVTLNKNVPEVATLQAQHEQPTQQPVSTSDSGLASETTGPEIRQLVQLAEPVVHELWQTISTLAQQSDKGPQELHMNFRTDPPLLPFSSMNQETLQLASTKHETNRLSSWVLHDRIASSVLDNPYERVGGGLFFTPTQGNHSENSSSHHAVKWKAGRQTRLGVGGRMIHRIRLELEVGGQPLVCILTAQRPQLLVHFVSEETKMRKFLEKGAEVVTAPLRNIGWDLVGWTTGAPAENGEEN